MTPDLHEEDEAPTDAARARGTGTPLESFSRGRFSVARPTRHWYIAARSDELHEKPLPVTLFGLPLVLFRDGRGTASAFLDRCPHRNVPLSMGRVVGGQLECSYHGWRFDGSGECRAVPSLTDGSDARSRSATAFPTLERDGYVWVVPIAGERPDHEPYRFRHLDDPGYATVRHAVDSPATLHATLENALDVPHTQFLHRGLFRNESRGIKVEARVKRTGERVEAEYVGEPRPTGLAGRMLSPSGGVVTHFDRFILPSVAEVEYRIGDENHILVMAAMTPIEDFVTRIHAVVALRLRVPAALVAPVMKPLALQIFAQDAVMLARQTETIRRFGGEQYASTEIDVLGRHILRLLRAAERGHSGGEGLHEETITLEI